MLIKAYGLFWNPDMVEWGKQGPGNEGHIIANVKIAKESAKIDFWNSRGIYILHENFRTIYVGRAWRVPLGTRLRSHLTDRFAGRWDMFSWFSMSKPNKLAKNVGRPGKRQVGPLTVIKTLESIGILITDAPLNRKRESIPGAMSAEQLRSPHPHTVRHYLETILSRLPDKVGKAKKKK
jgi:hypothetical protein